MATNFERQGFVSVLGGMNGSITPSLLADTQYAYGSNVSSRKGLLKTRPRWQRAVAYIPPGVFQGCYVYEARYNNYLAVVVSGTLYLIDLETFARIRCGTFPIVNFDRAYFCRADRFLIVQNGVFSPVECWPLIMDGELCLDNGQIQLLYTAVGEETASWIRFREHPTYDAMRVPIGTHMAYGHGRLFVVVSRLWDNGLISSTAQWLSVDTDTYFVAGDVVQPDNADEVLAFTETDYLANGGAFSLPTEAGRIKGFQFFRNAATGTGAGELVAFGDHGVSAFGVNAPRDQWSQIALAQVLFTDTGACAENSIMSVNGDLAFRASDGIRLVSYAHANAEASSGSLTNLSQSVEISSILDEDTKLTRPWSSMIWADNRFLPTVYGGIDGDVYNSHYFRGLAPLDTYVVGSTGPSSSLAARSAPAYDGVWNGLEILQVLKLPGDEYDVASAIVRANSGGRLELWALDDDATYDGVSDRPLCRLQTRVYDFNKPMDPKEFKYAELWVSSLRGQVDFTLYFRPDNYSLWTQTNSVRVQACETGNTQQRWCLRFASSPDKQYFDAATNRDTKRGFTFEFMLEWRGVATIDKAGFYALIQPNSSPNLGCPVEVCQVLEASDSTGLILDLMEYEVSPQVPLADPGERGVIARPEGAPIVWGTEDDYYIIAGDAGYSQPYVWSQSTGALLSSGDGTSMSAGEVVHYESTEAEVSGGGVAGNGSSGSGSGNEIPTLPVPNLGPNPNPDAKPGVVNYYSTPTPTPVQITEAPQTAPATASPNPSGNTNTSSLVPYLEAFSDENRRNECIHVERGEAFDIPIAQYQLYTYYDANGIQHTEYTQQAWPGIVSNDVTITLTGGDTGDVISAGTATVTWGADGRATISGVTISGGTATNKEVTLQIGGTIAGSSLRGSGCVILDASATFTISGSITDEDSTALSGVSVSCSAGSGTSDVDGVYQIIDVPPGTYTLTPGGGNFTPPTIPGVVVTETNITGQDFTREIWEGSLGIYWANTVLPAPPPYPQVGPGSATPTRDSTYLASKGYYCWWIVGGYNNWAVAQIRFHPQTNAWSVSFAYGHGDQLPSYCWYGAVDGNASISNSPGASFTPSSFNESGKPSFDMTFTCSTLPAEGYTTAPAIRMYTV